MEAWWQQACWGYVTSVKVAETWVVFTVPPFRICLSGILMPFCFMLPVAIAPAIEHLGDILAISSVAGEDYVENPGLHRTLLGDGIATSLAAAGGRASQYHLFGSDGGRDADSNLLTP